MPQILREPGDNLGITLSSTIGNCTAVVFQRRTRKASVVFEAVAGRVSWSETDQAAMSAHDLPVPAAALFTCWLPRSAFTTHARDVGYITVVSQPTDGDTVTVSDGTTTVVFEFDDDAAVTGTNTSVTIGASAAATTTNLAAAITASALLADSDVDARTTTQANWIATTAAAAVRVTGHSAPTVTRDVYLGHDLVVLYLAAAGASAVVDVFAEGEVS